MPSFVEFFLCTLRLYLLFQSRNAGSRILTPSEARWATSIKLLPSTAYRRPDIHLKILESLLK